MKRLIMSIQRYCSAVKGYFFNRSRLGSASHVEHETIPTFVVLDVFERLFPLLYDVALVQRVGNRQAYQGELRLRLCLLHFGIDALHSLPRRRRLEVTMMDRQVSIRPVPTAEPGDSITSPPLAQIDRGSSRSLSACGGVERTQQVLIGCGSELVP